LYFRIRGASLEFPYNVIMRVFFIFAVSAGLLIYSTGLTAPLHLDDPNVLTIAERVGWSTRALGYASFWLNRQILLFIGSVLPWREAFYYRLGNVFIHAIAATALFWLAREITQRWLTAALAGALFLVHPIQTQAVTYISQRFESQAAMFMFLSAAAYARFRRTNTKLWIPAVVVFAIAAALTKETAVVLPLWLLFIEFVFFEGTQLRRLVVYMAGLGLLLVVPALRAFQGSGQVTLGWIRWDQYFLTQGPILTKYFELATWPRRQFLFYDFQPVSSITATVVLEWLLVIGVAAAGVYLLTRQRLIGFGVISFFILLLPVILLPLPDLIVEHRLYGAFAGVAIAVAGSVQVINRKWAVAGVAILAVALAVRTARRNSEWQDQLTFLEMHHAAFPRDPQILTRLASYYFMSGYVNKSLELNLEARRYEDRFNTYYSQQGHVLTAINLSSVYLAKSDFQNAEIEARRAIAAKPNEGYAWRALGYVQMQERKFPDAVESFKRYSELRPGGDAWQALQVAATRAGDAATAKLAAEKLNAESEKASAVAVSAGVQERHKSLAIFGLTLAVLGAIAWAVYTVWTTVSGLINHKYTKTQRNAPNTVH
jgi:hypothetical protein